MRNIIRKQSVTVTLAVYGCFCLFGSIIMWYRNFVSIWHILLAVVLGILFGVIISVIEYFLQYPRNQQIYRPSLLPYIVMWVFVLLISILREVNEAFFLTCCGFYLLSLAFVFMLYEKRKTNRRITWNEILKT